MMTAMTKYSSVRGYATDREGETVDQSMQGTDKLQKMAFNPSTHEQKACGSLRVGGQLDLQRKFQDSLGYMEKSCLENPTNQPTKKQTMITERHGAMTGGKRKRGRRKNETPLWQNGRPGVMFEQAGQV